MSEDHKSKGLKGALIKAPFLLHLMLAALSGVGLSFAQAPHNLWFIIFPCFAVFYILYASAGTKRCVFLVGFVFALGYFIAGLNWIGNALLVEGNEYRWVWPLAVIALPTLLSLFTALYVTIAHILFYKRSWAGFLGFCALLSVSEWVRGYAFTGFPWNLYGYGITRFFTLDQTLSFMGPYGLTLLTVIWGCSFGFLFIKTHKFSKLIISILCLCSIVGFSYYGLDRITKSARINFHENLNIHIVQPNIEQANKWKPERFNQNFEDHISLSTLDTAPENRNIIVWPETSMPPAFLNNQAINERIFSVLGDGDVLLAGGLDVDLNERAPQYHNALMIWQNNAAGQRLYSKSHLVPFGEYIPFQQYIPIPTITQFSGFQAGDGAKTVKGASLPSFSPLICYEIIFPHKVVMQSNRPDYILTVTNDGWYGDSAGPYQHFEQARFRAIEQGIPVVRAANTGISGVIDGYGRIIDKTNLLEKDAISVKLPLSSSMTMYAEHGDRIYSALIVIFLIFAMFWGRKE